jgi:hypothetical protein
MTYKPQLDKVSSGDTTADYLSTKLVEGANISITKNNSGGNETLTITGTGGGGGGSDFFNVVTYGATGNGSTNDTTSVQDAITAAAAVGGIVYLPPGTYLCDTLTMSRNVSMLGAGWDSIIKSNGAATLLDYPTWSVWSYKGARLQDFALDGASTGTIGIDFEGAAYFTLDRLQIHDFTDQGLRLRSFLLSKIYDLEMYGCPLGIDADSMTVTPGPGFVQSNDVTLFNCTIITATSWAINWKGGSLINLDSCTFETNGINGNAATGAIYYEPMHEGIGLSLKNCWFEANYYVNIRIAGPEAAGQYCIIENTHFINYTSVNYGIYLEGAGLHNNLICRNVQFYDNATTADYYIYGTEATIYLDHCTGTRGPTGTFLATMDNPITAEDDIVVGGAAGVVTRLGMGSDNQVLGISPTTHHLAYLVQSGNIKSSGTIYDGHISVWDGDGYHLKDGGDLSSIGGGEVLMQDGVTAPPIPIENESRNDWLFEG